MAIPSLVMRPSAEAAGRLYSVLPNNGDGDFQFNRDSSATLINSKGLIQTVGYFGSELVVNKYFNDSSWWGLDPSWSISGGSANSNGTGTIYKGGVVTIGKTYKVAVSVSSYTSGALTYPNASNYNIPSAVGVYTFYYTANSQTISLTGNSFIGSIDSVSVKEVLGDRPRFNYEITNGLVGGCPSFLLEGQRTNYISYSEKFSLWTITSSITVSDNQVISPDGTLNASILDFTSAVSSDGVYSFTGNRTGSLSRSIYLKGAVGGETVQLSDPYLGGGSIKTLTTEWQRFLYISTAESLNSGIWLRNSPGNVIYAYAAQLEEGSYATSYIPTLNGVIQTRAAETCFGAGNASTFNSTEGTIYFEGSALADDGTNRYFSLDDGTASNYIYFRYVSTSNNVLFRTAIAGVTINTLTVVLSDTTQNHKFAFKWKSGDYALWVDGVEISTDSSATTFPSNTLNNLGFKFPSSTGGFYANTKDIRVYNEALTDLQLQKLTTL